MSIHPSRTGLTLVGTVCVVAVLAILVSFGVPQLMSTRLASNELAAIATLRGLGAAEARVKASAALDSDSDGEGEYAFLAELAGTRPLRRAKKAGADGASASGLLEPAILSKAFGRTDDAGLLARSGYHFAVFLPGSGASPAGVSEANFAGGARSSRNAEALWCAYAWPRELGKSGRRAFFINQAGIVLQMSNAGAGPQRYDGPGQRPEYSAAYKTANMRSLLAMGAVGHDGNTWSVVR